jgi:sn-glycerol 3-phosphate transport system substrate-binding protein
MGAKIIASGYTHHGVSWVLNYGILSQLMSKAGHTLVDHDNGRTGRATHLTIDDPVGLKAFTMLREMVADGSGIVAADDVTGLLALGSKDVAMAVGSTSDMLGNILKVQREQAPPPGVELSAAPLPTLAVSETGGSNFRGAPVYVVKGKDPAKVEAAYRFALWLSEPAQQAALHAKTGSIPVRESVADRPEIKALWARDPLFRVGFDEVSTPGSPPGGGAAVIGPARQVGDIILNGWTAAAKGEADPRAAIAKVTREADAALAQYEEQLRAGG